MLKRKNIKNQLVYKFLHRLFFQFFAFHSATSLPVLRPPSADFANVPRPPSAGLPIVFGLNNLRLLSAFGGLCECSPPAFGGIADCLRAEYVKPS